MTLEAVELNSEQLAAYRSDGFVVLRSVFEPEVLFPILDAVGEGAISVTDSEGNEQELNVWTWCGDDLVGRFPRIAPMAGLAGALIGEPLYHWHSKISWKRPHTPGTWSWHQDYAFWKEEGCARPAMATVSVAIDDNDVSNGCLRVMRGSHLVGGIDHPAVGHGRAADPDIIKSLSRNHEIVNLILAPGDVVAFHCNTLHTSGPNESDRARTLLHCSYNSVGNGPSDPFIDGHQEHVLESLPVAAIHPGAYSSVMGLTRFIPSEENGYSGRLGYQVQAATDG